VDTPITESDITAFYVWIPRYKYRVWNITRQAGNEATYAYSAYTKGIDIKWEAGTDSTGNVECTYDVTTPESESNLSDVCVYNGVTTIKTTSGNSNFKNAWYTHPAFTFAGDELEGFWIGKFETTGEAASPTILPDVTSLRNQAVSNQFTTSRVFQNYLTDNINAHMLTNLEWGAVAYLTHSIYGMCDETSCGKIYTNNSGSTSVSCGTNMFYTGRSSGSSYTSNTCYGSYNYKGYKLDSSGVVTEEKDITQVASTTRNVTGIYDMSGGAHDFLMSNMYNVFDPLSTSAGWNGKNILESKYYNSYSYGTSDLDAKAFNRSMLGDAIAEVAFFYNAAAAGWNDSVWGQSTPLKMISETKQWFVRGGFYNNGAFGIFYTESTSFTGHNNYAFRSALS